MFKFFNTISNLIGVIADFVATLVQGIINLFEAIAMGMKYAWELGALLPDWIWALVIIIISYSIVTSILNKGD